MRNICNCVTTAEDLEWDFILKVKDVEGDLNASCN